MKIIIKQISLLFFLSLLTATTLSAMEWERVVNLRGYWKFSIGDDMKWATPDYNDVSWEEIRVPSSWESEGFHGYNGYAWYRTTFEFPKDADGYSLMLKMGYIDDVDEVYINGKLVGKSGSFPPDYSTAYYANRNYPIPGKYLTTEGENVIAVRVFDSQMDGGIVRGDIGIYAYTRGMKLDVNLEGEWKFNTGDNHDWSKTNYDDSNWDYILVPGYWESRGWADYNGFAWYRIKFFVPEKLRGKKLVLSLGKIDDIDETYLNGTKVGFTGEMYDNMRKSRFDYEYRQFRGYFIPDGVIKFGEENTIAVRVYDGYINGGIYEGPIGLTTQEKYRDYWRDRKSNKNIWELIFGN